MKKHTEPTFDFLPLTDSAAAKILKENKISLLPAEARYFQKKLSRPLTLTELTVISIQGSEHCSYRSSRRHLRNLPTKGKNVLLGVGEDAGIIEIAREGKLRWGLAVGHESHNHPSQLVPYEGAATGVGGCVRDIVCMGARVVGCADPLRFGDLKTDWTRYLTSEVVRGIAGYGNPLGVPNLGGDIEFDPSFDSNCLVNVLAAGVLREDEIIHSYCPEEAARVGYDIIIVGKPTDRSGFGGASFASGTLDEDDAESNRGAVQEPNPFLERHILVASYDLFAELKKKKLLDKVSFKDMGAGGNVCASVEQVEPRGFGAEIDLEKVHLGEEGLPPHVIACAETQERFCWVCHPKVTPLILKTYNEKWELPKVAENARASVVGKVRIGNYVLRWHGETLVDAPSSVLTEGLSYNRPFKRKVKKVRENLPDFRKLDFAKTVKKLLASENIASRQKIFESYDRQVQGGSALDAGHGGPGVFQPLANTEAPENLKQIGISLGLGGSASLGHHSAKLQAEHAVAEAVANSVAIGARPLALTDCLNYGNPEVPAQMAELVDGIAGLKKSAEALDLPFVSGNVSLYNNEVSGNSINPSAIVGCFAKIKNAKKSLSAKFQSAGNSLVLVGRRSKNLAGSELLRVLKKSSGKTFSIDFAKFAAESDFTATAAEKNLLASARDLHRGGVAIAALESAFETDFGVLLDTANLKTAELFSENPGYLLEVPTKNLEKLATLAGEKNVELQVIGSVTGEPRAIFADAKKVLLDEKIQKLEKIWRESFGKKIAS